MQALRYQFVGVEAATHELIVIVLEVAHTGIHEQFVAVLHLDDKRVERVDDTVAVGDDDLLGIGVRHGREIVLEERFVGRELHHLRVHHDEFEFRRMFLIKKRSDDGVDGDGLTRSRGTGYEEVRSLGEVEHKDLVGDGSAVRYRQLHFRLFLETFGGDDGVHGDHLRFLVRHLYTDGSFTRHRRDDTDSGGGERHHDIVLKRLDLRYANTCFRHYLIERDGRSDGGFDGVDLDAVIAKGCHDTCAVRTLFLFVDDRRGFVVIDLEKVERRELKELQIFARIVRTEFLEDLIGVFVVELVFDDVFDR